MKTRPVQATNSIAKIFVLLIIITLLLSGFGYLYYLFEKKSITKAKHEEIEAIADMKISQIVQWRNGRITEVEVTSKANFLAAAIKEWLEDKNNKPLETKIINSLLLRKDNYVYEDIFLVSDAGESLISTHHGAVRFNSYTGLKVLEAAKSGRIECSDLYYCPVHKKIHYDIIAPVVDNDHISIAVLIFRIDPEKYLYPLVQSWPMHGKTSETLLVRKDGDDVLFLNELRFRKNTALKLRMPLTRKNVPAVKAVLGYRGTFEGDDYRDVPVVSYIGPIPGTPWFMIAKVDKSEIYAELKYRAVVITILTLVLIVFAITGISLIYKSRQKNIYQDLLLKEKELNATYQEYKTTLYSIGDAVITTDDRGIIRHLNPVAEQLTGWKEAEASGTLIENVFRIVNEESGNKAENPVDRVLLEGVIVGLANHTLLISKDGKETPIADSGAPIKNESGEITGVVLVFRDQAVERAAQKMLMESEARYRLTLDNMMEGCQIISHDWCYVYLNEAVTKHGRLKKEEMLGHTLMEVYPAIEKTEMFATLQRCMNDRSVEQLVNKFDYPDGSFAWFELSIQPVPEGIFILSIDISDRIKAEQELRHSELVYRNLVQNLHAGVVVHGPDSGIIIANEQAAILLGLSIDQMMGRTVIDPAWCFVNDDGSRMPQEEYPVSRVIRTQVPLHNLEIGINHPGTNDRVWVLVNAFPELSIEGQLRQVIVTFIDITERKKAEEAYKQSEGRYRSYVEITGQVAWVTNPEGEITEEVPSFSKFTGLSSDEVKGNGWVSALHPADIENTLQTWHKAVLSGIPYETEYRLKRHDGLYRDILARGYPVFDNDGNVLEWVGTCIDITERKQAEEKIREKDIQFRKLSSNLPDLIFQFTRKPDGTYCVPVASEGIKNIFGCSPEDVIDDFEPISRVISPDDAARVISDIEYSAEHLTYFTCEFRVQIPGKEIQWIYSKSTPEKLPDGSVTWYGFNANITERRKADEALKESEFKFRNTLLFLDEGYYGVTPEGILLDHNRAFARILGFSDDQDLKGIKLPDFWQNPEERQAYLGELILKGSISNYLINIKTQGGMKITVLASSHMTKDTNNNPLRIEGIFLDITDRVRAEKELKEAKENLEKRVAERTSELLKIKQLLDETGSTAKIGGWEMDLETKKQTWTKAVYEIHELGFDFDPTLDNGISYYSPEAMPVITKAIEMCIKYGEAWDLELPFITAKGNKIMVRSTGKAYMDNDKITRIGGVFQDISQIKQAQEDLHSTNEVLKAANKELEAFSYSVSHDLRAPLRSIDGFSNLLLKNYSEILDEQGKDYFQRVMKASKKMGLLVDEILKLSRYTRSEIKRENVDISSQAVLISGEIKAANPKRKSGIIIQPGMFANVDRNLIQIALQNLFSNAWKYSMYKPETKIAFGSIVKEGKTVYFIRDNGAGFDMKYVDKLFGAFQRLHTNAEFEGIGIGLATVSRIIHRHGGTIWAEGEVGKGATFYFTL
jgi:PAS domain S-box-containing protein